MIIIKNILISLVALLHIYFLILEMFLWAKPAGLKAFAMTLEQAQATSVMAANQGLYNGFLAAGLIWSLLHPDAIFSKQIALFFLGCVICAGLYGWYSVNIKILFIQGGPALLALALTLLV